MRALHVWEVKQNGRQLTQLYYSRALAEEQALEQCSYSCNVAPEHIAVERSLIGTKFSGPSDRMSQSIAYVSRKRMYDADKEEL